MNNIEELKFSRVFNENSDFINGTPTTSWVGATVHATIVGGSGDISWHVEGVTGVKIINVGKDSADFYFTEDMQKNIDGYLVATDNATGAEARHHFKIAHFFKSYGVFAKRNPDETYPEVDAMINLYNEWGSFEAYPVWGFYNGEDTIYSYWYNDPDNQGFIDLYNGYVGYTVDEFEYGIAKE